MYKFALNLQRAETICQVHVNMYVAKFKDQSSLEFPLTGKFLLSTESITSVAFQLNPQSQYLIYSRIFRTFPIAIVFPEEKKKITQLQIYLQFEIILHIQPSAFLITIQTFDSSHNNKENNF